MTDEGSKGFFNGPKKILENMQDMQEDLALEKGRVKGPYKGQCQLETGARLCGSCFYLN